MNGKMLEILLGFLDMYPGLDGSAPLSGSSRWILWVDGGHAHDRNKGVEADGG